eukprot:6993797-Alexandrium_andersonii.AAC.1
MPRGLACWSACRATQPRGEDGRAIAGPVAQLAVQPRPDRAGAVAGGRWRGPAAGGRRGPLGRVCGQRRGLTRSAARAAQQASLSPTGRRVGDGSAVGGPGLSPDPIGPP